MNHIRAGGGATATNFFARKGMEDTKVAQADNDDPAEVAKQGFEAPRLRASLTVTGSYSGTVQMPTCS